MSQLTPYDLAVREIQSPEVRKAFDLALCDKKIRFDAEAGFAMQIMRGNDYLAKIAMANPQSLRDAITNVAAIGISLNPAEKQAYLVPRKGAICLDISYMGLMDLATETGSIQWGQAQIVRKNDVFEMPAVGDRPSHKFNPFATNEERGEIIGVYVVVKTAEGDYLTHAMTIAAVYDIRDRSEAWKAFVNNNSKNCPWNTDPEEMIKKTCVKQASKYWPKNPRLDKATHYLNTDGGEGLAEKDMGNAEVVPANVDFEAHIKHIGSLLTKDALRTYWKACCAECSAAKDKVAYEKIKEAVLNQGGVIADLLAAEQQA